MHLTSPKNPLLQKIRRAASSGRPTDAGLIVAEGPHLLEESLHGMWQIEQIFVTPEARNRYSDLLQKVSCEVIEVSEHAFAATSATETTQEILAVLAPRRWSWQDVAPASALVVVMDGVQDPGNAGTIVRSAEAFGATGVVFLAGCARVSNGKLLRATAGSIFRLPFLEGVSISQFISHVRASDLSLYALAASGASDLAQADFQAQCAVAVGSEGAGVSPELLSQAQTLRIPTTRVDSLNAAVACSIALFVAQQQRGSP